MQTHQEYDLFISYNEHDIIMAEKVYESIKILYPKWNVFFDDKRSLEQGSADYKEEINKALKHSRKLIFVSSDEEHCLKGNGFMHYEVNIFQTLQQYSRRTGFNEEYFGIIIDKVNIDNIPDCFSYTEIIKVKNIDEINVETIVYLLENKYHDDILYNSDERFVINKNIMLDKTTVFAINKQKQNKYFSEEMILDELIPTLLDNEDKEYCFSHLLDLLSENNILLIGAEGGAGKTTMLTKLFYLCLRDINNNEIHNNYVPIYVDLNTITAKNHFLERYLLREFYKETQAMYRDELNVWSQLIENELKLNVQSPNYLLILDGYNEIPVEYIENFKKELQQIANWKNVRIILSSRTFDHILTESSNFLRLRLNKLSSEQIKAFIEKKHKDFSSIKINKSLLSVLSNPMYLDIYTQFDKINNIKTKGDLLLQFLKWQALKENFLCCYSGKESEQNKFCLLYVLPVVAYYMVTKKQTVPNYNISKTELLNLVDDILTENSKFLGKENSLFTDFYFEYYDLDNITTLMIEEKFYNCNGLRKRNRDKYILNYFENVCCLIRINSQGDFEFIHQNYRDFFCAMFIAREMNIAKNAWKFKPISLSNALYDTDVISFISDILREQDFIPKCDNDSLIIDYKCNEESTAYKNLNLYREADDAIAPSNIIEILKYARKNDLSNCDFSKLNLTASKLNRCIFVRCYADKYYPSSFESATINVENILCRDHFNKINAACLCGEDVLAVYDCSGMLKFWNLKNKLKFPEKCLFGVNFEIKKMLYNKFDNSIVAMTDYEILKIPISNGKVFKMYKSKDKLREIFISSLGEIEFITDLNPFNLKSVYNPKKKDSNLFYCFSSASSINSENNHLAFGSIRGNGQFGLRIYKLDSQRNKWLHNNTVIKNHLNKNLKKVCVIKHIPHENKLIFSNRNFLYEYDCNNKSFKIILKLCSDIKGVILYPARRIVYSNQEVLVTDNNGIILFVLNKKNIGFFNFIKSVDSNCFYAVNNEFIYKFNDKLECVNSFFNPFSSPKITSLSDESQKEDYFLRKNKVFSVQKECVISNDCNLSFREIDVSFFDKMCCKQINGNLMIYDRNTLFCLSKLELQYGLIVNLCNFKNLKGTMASTNNLKILNEYGGITSYNNHKFNEQPKQEENVAKLDTILQLNEPKLFKCFETNLLEYNPNIDFRRTWLGSSNIKEPLAWEIINEAGKIRTIDSNDFLILYWIGKLKFATKTMILNLCQSQIIPFVSGQRIWNSIFKLCEYKLLDNYTFYHMNNFSELKPSFFMLGNIAYEFLNSLGYAVIDSRTLQHYSTSEVKEILALNQWVCGMLQRFKSKITEFDLDVDFCTDSYYDGKFNVKAYVNLFDQPFFAYAFRDDSSVFTEEYCKKQIKKLCIMVENFKNLTIGLRNGNFIKKPIVVIICENMNHFKKLYKILKEIITDVKIIYTTDNLVIDNIESAFFEVINGKLVKVHIN